MLRIKPIRRIIGFVTVFSSIIWISISLVIMYVSYTMVDGFSQKIQTQQADIQTLVQGLQTQIKDIPFIDGVKKNINDLGNITDLAFTGILAVIGFVKLGMMALPILIITSQFLPIAFGFELLFTNYYA